MSFNLFSQNITGINQNFQFFLEYSAKSFQKDSIVLYRPYENPIKIAILKDNYGYKAALKGVFEYREELLRKDGYFTGRVFIRVFTDYKFRLEVEHSTPKSAENPFYMVPGFFYSLNLATNTVSLSDKLSKNFAANTQIRADRSTHPSVIVIKNKQVFMVGCQETTNGNDTLHRNSVLEPLYPYNGIFIYTKNEKMDKIGFSIGYKHIPFRYKGLQNSNNLQSFDTTHTEGWIEKKMGKVLTFKSIYYVSSAIQSIESYQKAVQCYYKEFRQISVPRATKQEATKKLINTLLLDAWQPKYRYFYASNNFRIDSNTTYLSGSLIAYTLLKTGIKNNDLAAIDTAKRFFNEICANAIHEKSSLIYESKIQNLYTLEIMKTQNKSMQIDSGTVAFSAAEQGHFLYFLLKSYIASNNSQNLWLETAIKSLHKIALSVHTNGEMPVYFNENGIGFSYSATTSTWLSAAFALLYDITNDIQYLNISQKIIKKYADFSNKSANTVPFLKNYMLVGQDNNIAFIKSCYELHYLTKNMDYVRMAMDALQYEFTFKFCYNSKHSNLPLQQLNFPTSGGSLASLPKVAIHSLGNLVAYELYYFYVITQDMYLFNRLNDICKWGLCTFNRTDSELGFGKTGWTPGLFYHSDASFDGNIWDGSVEKSYNPYSAASVLLSTVEDIPDSYFE